MCCAIPHEATLAKSLSKAMSCIDVAERNTVPAETKATDSQSGVTDSKTVEGLLCAYLVLTSFFLITIPGQNQGKNTGLSELFSFPKHPNTCP